MCAPLAAPCAETSLLSHPKRECCCGDTCRCGLSCAESSGSPRGGPPATVERDLRDLGKIVLSQVYAGRESADVLYIAPVEGTGLVPIAPANSLLAQHTLLRV
jgi:hypothetical protein